ncbi:MAG: nitrous oxide-stimulated promoter family protein [Anaerolineae bacterium]|jgi:protein-S-isoprenylcysteine O-methyltransferase Ste14|nr:nitrous oxide-stimulated promoter family protein [Anaerolineae bacterium]
MKQGRLERERHTIRVMIEIACAGQHHTTSGLCEECQELVEYALQRIEKCPYQEAKPTCARCPIHCYKPAMRERIRAVMRYAGPRMLLYHPILTLQHTLDQIGKGKSAARTIHFVVVQALQTAWLFIVFGGILFASAGRFDWWEAWAFLIIYFLIALTSAIRMAQTNPELVRERSHPGKNVKQWDNVLVGINLLLTLALYAVIGLDAGRYGWSEMPAWVRLVGLWGFIPAFGLPLWASKVNAYLSSRVRIQQDRGHTVVAEGPYRYVRHPMYVGMIFYNISVPLVLGSWWGLTVSGLMIVAVIARTAFEDKTLQRELPGYSEYSQRVQYRLFPGVW